jgi:hypothetical protein
MSPHGDWPPPSRVPPLGPPGQRKKKLVKKRGGKKLGKNIVFFHSVNVWCPGSAEKSNLFTVIFFFQLVGSQSVIQRIRSEVVELF